MLSYWKASSYLTSTGSGVSSTPGFSKSSNDASGEVFQSSSNLMIYVKDRGSDGGERMGACECEREERVGWMTIMIVTHMQ